MIAFVLFLIVYLMVGAVFTIWFFCTGVETGWEKLWYFAFGLTWPLMVWCMNFDED